jgi:Cys-tRNA(Pro)/Cys-tRNA(Cys) deacylase
MSKGLPFSHIGRIFISMKEIPPASQYLTRNNIPHRVFRHSGPVDSFEQAAQERGQNPEQVVRSIVFRLGVDQFVMVLIAGPAQVSWPVLRAKLGVSRLTMASEEEVFQATSYRIGAVSPFGLPAPIPILADETIFLPEEISIGSGERGIAIIIKSGEFRKALGDIEVGQFARVD